MRKAPTHCARTWVRYGQRPIRICANGKRNLPHRCYRFPVRAVNAAAAMMNWVPARTLEVYNAQTGRLYSVHKVDHDGRISVWIDEKLKQSMGALKTIVEEASTEAAA